MNFEFSWDGPTFCFFPCPNFPGLDDFCLSLPRVLSIKSYCSESQKLFLVTNCYSFEDRFRFENAFKTWISLAFLTAGVC